MHPIAIPLFLLSHYLKTRPEMCKEPALFTRKDGGMLRTMNSDKLLKTLPVVQQQLDALVEYDCTAQVRDC